MGHGPREEGREEAETEEEGDISLSVAIGEGDVVDVAGGVPEQIGRHIEEGGPQRG